MYLSKTTEKREQRLFSDTRHNVANKELARGSSKLVLYTMPPDTLMYQSLSDVLHTQHKTYPDLWVAGGAKQKHRIWMDEHGNHKLYATRDHDGVTYVI